MSNFGFLQDKKMFNSFADVCVEAEKAMQVSPATCAVCCKSVRFNF